jgi:hypothetical protein
VSLTSACSRPSAVRFSQNRSFRIAAVIWESGEEPFIQVRCRRDKDTGIAAALLRLLVLPTKTWGFWLGINIDGGCEALLVLLGRTLPTMAMR